MGFWKKKPFRIYGCLIFERSGVLKIRVKSSARYTVVWIITQPAVYIDAVTQIITFYGTYYATETVAGQHVFNVKLLRYGNRVKY